MSIYLQSATAKTFRKLTKDLKVVGDATKIDNINGAFMPVCVELIGTVQGRSQDETISVYKHYSIAHYGKLNGDAMRDPEMTFLVAENSDLIIPVSYRNDYSGIDAKYWNVKKDGKLYLNMFMVSDMVDFCKTWFKNIRDQQEL